MPPAGSAQRVDARLAARDPNGSARDLLPRRGEARDGGEGGGEAAEVGETAGESEEEDAAVCEERKGWRLEGGGCAPQCEVGEPQCEVVGEPQCEVAAV